MNVYPEKSSLFTEVQAYWEIIILEFTSDNIFNAKKCLDTFSLNLLFTTNMYIPVHLIAYTAITFPWICFGITPGM